MLKSEVSAFIQRHIPDDELQAFYQIANNPVSLNSGINDTLKSIVYLIKRYANTKNDEFKATMCFVLMNMANAQQNRPRGTGMNVNPYVVSI
jgi:hypothetical protein